MSARDLDAAVARRDAAIGWCLRLAEGRLTPEERVLFDTWLASDPCHGPLFDEAVTLWQGVEDQAASADMIVLRSAALESLRKANRGRWMRTSFRPPHLWAAAAAILVTMALAGWGVGQPRIYRTGIGERQVIALADGSKLSLDADSEVKVRYSRQDRDLELARGRARFSVAKDPSRPFRVKAAGEVVIATGTEFSVERLRDQVRVILYEGHVAVLADHAGKSGGLPTRPVLVGSTHAPAGQVLKPGGELVLESAAPIAQLARVDPGRSLAWEGGQLMFSDVPLAQAVERENRYADHPITIADASAGRILISGVFTAGDINAFVEGVTAAFPVDARPRTMGAWNSTIVRRSGE